MSALPKRLPIFYYFGRMDALLETIGIGLSFCIAEPSSFGSNFHSPEIHLRVIVGCAAAERQAAHRHQSDTHRHLNPKVIVFQWAG
jgi:hypothetical protein